MGSKSGPKALWCSDASGEGQRGVTLTLAGKTNAVSGKR